MECNIDSGTKKSINITFISFLLNKNVVQRAFFRKKKIRKTSNNKKIVAIFEKQPCQTSVFALRCKKWYNLSKSHC